MTGSFTPELLVFGESPHILRNNWRWYFCVFRNLHESYVLFL